MSGAGGPAVSEAAVADRVPTTAGDTPTASGSELLLALLLGAAALLTAVSAYLAASRNGEAQDHYTRASIVRIEAAKARNAGDQLRAFQMTLFVQYGQAVATGDRAVQRFIRDELGADAIVGAIDWFRAQDPKPVSPFVPGNPLNDNAFYDQAERLDEQSRAQYDAAVAAGTAGDRFTLATVVFAVVLFSSGIAGQFRRPAFQVGAFVAAGLFLLAGTALLLLTILR